MGYNIRLNECENGLVECESKTISKVRFLTLALKEGMCETDRLSRRALCRVVYQSKWGTLRKGQNFVIRWI